MKVLEDKIRIIFKFESEPVSSGYLQKNFQSSKNKPSEKWQVRIKSHVISYLVWNKFCK